MSKRGILTNMMSKKAQIMGMPYQMIFSVFLIAVFIVAAVIVIKPLVSSGEQTKILTFYQELQSEIGKAWVTESMTKTLPLALPTRVKAVCFSKKLENVKIENLNPDETKAYENLNLYKNKDANLYFYPDNSVSVFKIYPYMKISCGQGKMECLNLSNIPNNFYCFKNEGSLKITIEKKDNEKDVRIKI